MAETAAYTIPDHVPEELVYDFELQDPQEDLKAPYALLGRMREQAPDVFYLPRDWRRSRCGVCRSAAKRVRRPLGRSSCSARH